jgi:hypothetical protein
MPFELETKDRKLNLKNNIFPITGKAKLDRLRLRINHIANNNKQIAQEKVFFTIFCYSGLIGKY